MAVAQGRFPDLSKGTFVDLLRVEVAKHGVSLSGKAAHTVKWKDSGEAAAEDVHDKTIGPFANNFKDALARLNDDPAVLDYLSRAIAAIGSKAAELAEGGDVDGWHVRQAARWVIKRFRMACPRQLAKGTFEAANPSLKWAHGDLCRDFETLEE